MRFCQEYGISHDVCGKVIVAVDESEVPRLKNIYERGQQNGVVCRIIDAAELQELEPHCAGVQAIHVPDAGIVDYIGVSQTLAGLVHENGGEIRTGFKVVNLSVSASVVTIVSDSGDEIEAATVVNCAGLYSDRLARMSGDDPDVQIVPFRGEYYELVPEARYLCRNLIYPVPDPAYPFLGVHFTRMYDGSVECGPSAVIAFAREGYTFGTVNVRELAEIVRYRGFMRLAAKHWRKGISEVRQSLSKKYYVRQLRKLIPEIKAGDIVAAPSGVRAQALKSDGTMVDDFLIKRTGSVVNVYNAASPAATASLNIGRVIAGYV